MRFGQKCQGRASHEALVALQDAEIRLLENIKKCLTLRVKVDRDYANGLGELVAAANRLDTSDFKLPVFQAWSTIVKETEAQQRLIQENTEILCRRTLDRVCHLINEKKAARKYYVEERQRLEVEFQKLQEEPHKQKGDYEKLMEKFKNENTKYEVHSKGKSGSKSEDARNRVCKAGGKLHKTHNDYIVSLHDVTIHQRHYLTTTLPGLLNYQQEVQEAMINQSKQVLEEYVNLTNTSNEKFTACQRKMQQIVAVINRDSEYVEYVDEHKSDPLGQTTFEFDKNLLNDYNGKLNAGEIAVDDLTFTSIKECGTTILERLTTCRRRMEAKENELKTLEESLSQKLPDKELTDETRRNFEMQQQAVLVLKKEIAELNCATEKNKTLYNLVNDPIQQLEDADPPPALDLPSPPPELESDGSSSSSKVKLLTRITALIKPPRPQPLPHPDVLDNGEPSSHGSEARKDSVPEMERSFSVPSDGYQQENGITEEFDSSDNQLLRSVPANYGKSGAEGQMTLQPSQLEDMEWFHGVLPREEVQRLLVNDGDFLVRESKNRKTGQTQHVLSVMWGGHKHFIIQGQEGSWRFEGNQYPSIPELVIQQYQSNLPVTNKSQAILRTPIVREDWELNNDDIEQAEKIDNGHFGEVFRGYYKVTKQEVAIKICRETLSEDAKKKFLLEGRILKQYDHPNIVKFIGIAAQRQPVMIVMEFVSGGSLLKFLQSKGSQQTTKQLIKMCEDAAAGMAYLEDKGCIHRDLAARNCLVGKNQVVKISDFGMSREEEVYKVSDGLKQIPIKWTAPEALNLGEYTSMCDVWSYGVLMWEVFSHGDQPYNGQTNNQAREKIETGYRMPAPENTPELVYALMLRCWDGKPTNRPHFSEVHQELGRLRTVL